MNEKKRNDNFDIMNFSIYLFTYLLVYGLYTVVQLVDTNNNKKTYRATSVK